jgi:hypothetical protein
MDSARLRELGFGVRETKDSTEVDFELVSLNLVNPLSRKFLNKVTFSLIGDRLVAVDPAELVGIAPISLAGIQKTADLESQIQTAFNEHIFHLQRRSGELQGLGLQPKVDPANLELSTEVEGPGGLKFLIAADKRGNFRVSSARRGSQELDTSTGKSFELSEFRERGALVGYLTALFEADQPQRAKAPVKSGATAKAAPKEPADKDRVSLGDLIEHFGDTARFPPMSAVELLVELTVGDERYRFAAARVAGRNFRGLLAGADGKVWAERFNLDEFPGVIPLVAELLKVPIAAVTVLGAKEDGR